MDDDMDDEKGRAAYDDLKAVAASSFETARRRGTLPSQGTGHTVFLTEEQYAAVQLAIAAIREGRAYDIEPDPAMSEGKALELIAGDFLAGVGLVPEGSDGKAS